MEEYDEVELTAVIGRGVVASCMTATETSPFLRDDQLLKQRFCDEKEKEQNFFLCFREKPTETSYSGADKR